MITTEGVEGTITDLGIVTFTVTAPLPVISVEKQSTVISDPFSGTVNPKRVPGALVRYAITVRNSGPGPADAGTLLLTDVIPPDTELCVAASCASPVVEFVNGTLASGLTFNPAVHVGYSSNGWRCAVQLRSGSGCQWLRWQRQGTARRAAGTFAAASAAAIPAS